MDVNPQDPRIARVFAMALMRQAEGYLMSVGESEAVRHLQRAITALRDATGARPS